ncbi:MAG: HmuY family protein [Bacteroidales bacterium]|nr:HmuY family protein [Bacteroidales bacterium]
MCYRYIVKYIGLLLLMLYIISCFEEDERVDPYPGEVITIEDNIEFYQSYFDFETGMVVKSHSVNLWELGFESGENGWHIIHNSGAGWFIWNSGQNDIVANIEYPVNVIWSYDIQSAYPDSTSIGNWVNFREEENDYTGDVYLLGKISGGDYIQIKQLKFIHLDSLSYRFVYYERETEFSDTVIITKADSVNFIYYSFSEREQILPEPDYDEYDIMFCPYFDLATQFGVTIPYLVRGVLLNTTDTYGVIDSINSYNQIDYEMLDNYEFTSQRDIIGYRWKDVVINPDNGVATYSVRSNYNYVVQTGQGNYFKLRFLSFSLNGESGYPQFEYKELNELN